MIKTILVILIIVLPINSWAVNFPLKASANNRYLVDQDGIPFFIHGDSGWSLNGAATTAEYQTYLTDRANRGFNSVLIMVIDTTYCPNAPNNLDNVAPFSTPGDMSTPNDTYFAHLDGIVEYARGLNINLFLFVAYLGAGLDGWRSVLLANSNAQVQAYGHYLGNRYAGYGNIVWVMGGDQQLTPTELTRYSYIVTGIKQHDTNHLITIHGLDGHTSLDEIGSETWLTLNSIYEDWFVTGTYEYDATLTNYAITSPILPAYLIESCYENEHGSAVQAQRRQAWWSILSGACGHFFGNNPVWGFQYLDVNWANYLGSAGAVSMTHLKSFINSIEWFKLIPDSSHNVLTAGYGTYGQDDYVAAALTSNGTTLVIYLPTARQITVDMSKLLGPTALCQWYNPSTGVYTVIGTYDCSGSRNFTPSSGDWVFFAVSSVPIISGTRIVGGSIK